MLSTRPYNTKSMTKMDNKNLSHLLKLTRPRANPPITTAEVGGEQI
jgi:hypothetical protein